MHKKIKTRKCHQCHYRKEITKTNQFKHNISNLYCRIQARTMSLYPCMTSCKGIRNLTRLTQHCQVKIGWLGLSQDCQGTLTWETPHTTLRKIKLDNLRNGRIKRTQHTTQRIISHQTKSLQTRCCTSLKNQLLKGYRTKDIAMQMN